MFVESMNVARSFTRSFSFLGLVVPYEQLVNLIVQTLIFAAFGILIFALAIWIIVKATPFSVR